MKAITTKYHGPTNTRGSKIIASAGSNRVTVSYDDALDSEGNHDAAALALCEKMGWTQHHLMRGTLEDTARRSVGNVYTFEDHCNRLRIPEAMRDAEQVREIERRKERIAAAERGPEYEGCAIGCKGDNHAPNCRFAPLR